MATPTLANPCNSHQLIARMVRPFSPPDHSQSQPEFLVFPTGEAEYHWRVAASADNRTISRHKSLTFALKKCTWLNEQGSEGGGNETN